MKSRVSSFLFAIFISLFCSFCLASSKQSNLDKLILLSGLPKQTNEFPELVKSSFKQGVQQGGSIPEDEMSLLLDSIDKAILPSVILNEVQLSLEKSLSNRDIETLLQWYESDIGERITKAEEKASTPQAYQDMIHSAQQLLANTKRVEVAKRLDNLLGTTDMTMEIQKFSSIAVYSAIMTTLTPDQELDLATYKAQMAKIEPQMRASIQQFVIVSFVYSYRSIDDGSLARYEQFLNRPVTKKFNSSVVAGLMSGLKKVLANWADDIAAFLKDKVTRQSLSGA
ncbi:MAG: hypothetical protein CSA50_07505 [Gammaproteobacteria bacterium]|nr:MAG: hypothetical protein CSA50_07505 [Gammaproteobacteria bacterium]